MPFISRYPRNLVIVAALAWAIGCASTSQVMVVIEAGPCVASQGTVLAVTVTSEDGTVVHDSRVEVGSEPGADFPFHVPVVPRDGDASRRFSVDARFLDAAGALVAGAEGEFAFTAGQLVEAPLFLELDSSGPGVVIGGGAPGRTPVVARVGRALLDEPTWTDVLGAQIEVAPESDTDAWLILASARIQGEGHFLPPSSELRLVVSDGGTDEERSYVNGVTGGSWAPWSAVDWVVGGAPVSYRVQVRTEPVEITVSDIRLIALPVSGAAGLVGAAGDVEEKVTDMTWVDATSVCVPDAGPYLVLANASASDVDPSVADRDTRSAGVRMRVEAGGEVWGESQLQYSRASFRSYFAAREVSSGQVVRLQAQSVGAGPVTIRHPRIALVSIPALTAFSSVLDTDGLTSSDPAVVTSLSVPAAGAMADYLTIQGTWARIADHPDLHHVGLHLFSHDGGEPVIIPMYQVNPSDHLVATYFDVVSTDTAFSLENSITTNNPVGDPAVIVSESFIYALR